MPSHQIDPEKLLELCRDRLTGAGVTLSWASMLHIVDQLRRTSALLEELDKIDRKDCTHGHQKWAMAQEAIEQYKEASQ
ncbi:MAG: hypothetical protein ACQEUY_13190 [Pseudomonadota bacterium]